MKQGWEYKKLGEVCKINSGKSIKAKLISPTSAPNTFPCFGGNGIRGYVSSYSHDGIYPIVGRVGALCGNVHLADGKFYATEHALVLTITTQSVSANWLTLWLESNKLGQYAKGVAQPVLSASELSKLPLSVPPLSEQQSIVAELDKINEIIDLKKVQLKDLDLLAQSIFYEMFGDPIENPKGWEVKKLGEVYKVSSSKRIMQENWKDEGVPFLKVSDIVSLIKGNSVMPQTFIEETLYEELIALGVVPKQDDILITSRGTLGLCYIVKPDDRFYFQDGMITWLSQSTGEIHHTFLTYLFANEHFLQQLTSTANKSTVAYISIGQLSKRNVILPPLFLQQSFAEKIQAIESQKSAIKQSLAEMETLLASRMDYYFN